MWIFFYVCNNNIKLKIVQCKPGCKTRHILHSLRAEECSTHFTLACADSSLKDQLMHLTLRLKPTFMFSVSSTHYLSNYSLEKKTTVATGLRDKLNTAAAGHTEQQPEDEI